MKPHAECIGYGLQVFRNRRSEWICGIDEQSNGRRPGEQLTREFGPKRLELARELFPGATTVALLVNPANPLAATVSKDLQAVANTLGVRLHVLHASAEADFEAAFATAAQLRVSS